MTRRLSRLCLLALLSLSLSPSAGAQTAKYDAYFRRWGDFYFAGHDWHWWKAQSVAESGLNPTAASYCGARGLMQLMPATAKALGANALDPESAIQGGIKYDRQLWESWRAIVAADARRDYTFASYNAGPGNIARAWRAASQPPSWGATAAALPRITGAHAVETTGYVKRIRLIFNGLGGIQ
jgi:soluble lytic murein transglycosylase-like protein